MQCHTPAFFRLPRELRDEIYKLAVLEEEEVCMFPPKEPQSNFEHRIWTVRQPKYHARIVASGLEDGYALLATSAPLSQVDRQIRREASDIVEESKMPLVARVHNFDFEHIIKYLSEPTGTPRVRRHTVLNDGTVPRTLLVEMQGPYDDNWPQNLQHWVECIETLLPEEDAEFGSLHKVVWSPECRLPGKRDSRVYVRVIRAVQLMWRRRNRGAGRLALEKIFWAMYTHWRVGGGLDGALYVDQETMEWDIMSSRGIMPE